MSAFSSPLAHALRELLDAADGARLELADYKNRFAADFRTAGPLGFWKLEAAQTFCELDSASYQAFAAREWELAMALHLARRAELAAYATAAGFPIRRVRLVEVPLSRYLAWELPLLWLRNEAGMPVRVLDLAACPNVGRSEGCPEVVTIGENVAFELLYSDDGVQVGGIRHTDTSVVRQLRIVIEDLFTRAKPIEAFGVTA